jgi:hypothetical protein
MFTLDKVVPWDRSFEEYRGVFAIDEADLAGRVLGCGDGPASFNAEATRRGAAVVSCDPFYQWGVTEISARIDATYDQVLDQTRRNPNEFVWRSIASVEALGRVRMTTMQEFFNRLPRGSAGGEVRSGRTPIAAVSRPSVRPGPVFSLIVLVQQPSG